MKRLTTQLLFVAGVARNNHGVTWAHSWSSDDSGLATFVSRPDLRPQTWNITTLKPDLVSPGYYFSAPYYTLNKGNAIDEFRPGQIGPHIYDSDGELIWSGAIEENHQTSFDFRVNLYNGAPHLSYIVEKRVVRDGGKIYEGIIMDSSYHVVKRVHSNDGKDSIDLHEFNVLHGQDGANRALITISRTQLGNSTDLDISADRSVVDSGFEEVDIDTGKTLFRWWGSDHVPYSDSLDWQREQGTLDPYHGNSIDKTSAGDYIVSFRDACAVYRVSRNDGSIIWTLGGKRSNFTLLNFNFCFQHHVRILEENSTHTTVSLFNDAANNFKETDDHSSALFVVLNTGDMTAEATHIWDRPDGNLTQFRGSVQQLSNGNVLVGWSKFGYNSEFTMDGKLVKELIYSTERLSDYRTYKFEFKGFPTEPPALKVHAFGTSEAVVSIHYVSWNGATEVASWSFYGASSLSNTVNDSSVLLGSRDRTGFETMFITDTYHRYTYAEAFGADGKSLGKSPIKETIVPQGAQYEEDSSQRKLSPSMFRDNSISIALAIIMILMLITLFYNFGVRSSGGLHQKYSLLPSESGPAEDFNSADMVSGGSDL